MDWPWHVEITYTDGRVRAGDYSDDFDAIGFARNRSEDPGIVRVDVSVSFVAGEAVSPASAEVSG